MNANPSLFTLRHITAPFRKWLLAALATLAVFGSAPEALAQTTVTLTATRDSNLYSNDKNGDDINYGGCTYAWAGGKGANERERSLFAFDLTTLPANITISSAVLRLTTVSGTDTETTNRNVSVHSVSQVWTEGTGGCYPQTSVTSNVTWNNRTTGTAWSTAGGSFGAALATTSVGGLGAYNWTITSQAQSWYANSATNNGVLVKYVDETASDKYKAFATRENATSTSRPQLIITYTFNCTGSTGGATAVCVGSTANVTPASGGTWTSSNTAVATVTNAGVVTGVYPGSAVLTYTETANDCQYTRTITVNPRPVVGGGALGTGTGNVNYWFYDSVPAGATVDNIPTSGHLATGTVANFDANALQNTVDPGDADDLSIRYLGFIRIDTTGSYTFYTNSDDGSKLYLNNQLVVSNDGTHGLQEVSGTVSLTPGWYPLKVEFFQGNGPYGLTVSYQGPSIAKQAIPGSVLSTTAPTPSISGLCAGGSANVTPSTGGTWVSSNNSAVTVTDAGVVTGVAAGSATLTFTNTTTGCTNTVSVTVVAGPSLGGATSVCVGANANVTPGTGGTWSSSNNAVATVTNAGVVSGISAGSVTLTFTNTTTGCISTTSFTVTAQPTLGGASVVCPGQTANVTPASGGTWSSSNNAIATVSNAGLVTGVSAGTVTLTFTNTSTGCTNTRLFTVNAQTTLGGANSTCVGVNALVTPNTGGTWLSSNNAVATVTNAGVVSGVSAGSVTLSFTNSTTGCVSTKPFTVSVPFGGGGGAGIGGATAVCAGFQTNVTPATGGLWTTSNSSIATVTNAGVVTGFSPGVVVLTYTETVSGCVSTVDFTVYPDVTAGGANSVCQGAIANVTPTTNGTWVSSDPSIAFVNNSGFVTGLQPGTVTLTFTSLGGCTTAKSFTVNPKPIALGAASVQVGQTASVTPASGGTWTSSNPAIASVTNAGVVSGLAEGAVTLTFTDTVTGCSGTKSITVIDPGFYKNISSTDSGDKVDPDPENNTEPEVVFPQSFTALVVTVFQDIDGDSDGDQPVPNVTITVRDSQGNVVAVVTTALDGAYTFSDLPPGFYTVTQTVPNGNFTLGDNPIPVSVVENATVRADFVNSQLGQISGTILADAGDEAMPNVLVSLLDENGDPVLDSSNQPITTTTNSAGFYLFDQVHPGTYQVQQTVPNGYTAVDDVDGTDLTINGDVTPIVIAPGTVITNQDFVNFLPGSISGNISIDRDLNLAGDEPHVGVTVALLNSSGNPVLDGSNQPITTLTDSEGNYKFEGLNPGNYRVAQTVPSGFTAVSDTDGGSFTVVGDVTLLAVAAGTNQIANFLNQPQTDIAVDKSVNNSTPVVGTNVTFTVVVTNNGPQNATAVKVDDVALGMLYVSSSATKGSFANDPGAPSNNFAGLWTVGALNVGESATLTVVATVTPNAIVSTYNNYVNAYSELGDPNPSNNEDTVTLNPVLGTISGTVRRDTTGDNLGDVVVPNITVALVDLNGNPVLGANSLPLTAITDGSGAYSFSGLPPGSYRVVETVPSGDVAVNDVDGGDKAINGDIAPITLAAGQTISNQNFVIAAAGSIAGNITNDTSGDSFGDIPLEGVVVILLYPSGSPVLDENGDPITTVTDGLGNYSFTGLVPGNYIVSHVPPGGLFAKVDIDGGSLFTNGDITPIAVLPGQDVTGQNFIDSDFGTISGGVVYDTDFGGTDRDIPIGGVLLTLKDALGNDIDSDPNTPGIQPTTTTTAADGSYSFVDVKSGTYIVVETQPAGYSSYSDADGGDLNINGDVTPITLLPGGNVTNQNFVELLNGTISGSVLADSDGDGDGDIGIAGVTVALINSINDITVTTTTNSLGKYSFDDVPYGIYTVVETQPAGYSSVSDVDGGNLDIIGDVTPINLPPGGTVSNQDFVEILNVNINGIVLADTDGNGTGNTGIGGVLITLFDGSNNVVTTTTTLPDGSYEFPNLPPGTYTVVETDPPNYISLTPNSVTVTLTPGGGAYIPFTDTQNGTISGSVGHDADLDSGTKAVPIAGVLLTLKDALGNDIDSDPNTVGVQPTTATTDVQGNYSFANVSPGIYIVVETQPAGYSSLSDVDGGNLDIIGDVTPITLLPGGDLRNQDFVELLNVNINGIVLDDTDGNGTGDTGIGGVLITLLDENDDVVTTTTTLPDGSYEFPNLPPGTYTVVETDPPNYISLTPNSVTVTLAPGGSAYVPFTDAQFASITGNVFNDTNRLTDNTVNGTGTNAGGIYINLVNPTGNLVIASIPVNVDGTYTFSAANGVQINTNYILVLTPAEVTVGNVLTTASLPVPWYRTGENLGAGAGNDGTPDSKLAVSTTVGALANANFGIVQVCDLTPTITAVPNVMNGPIDFNIRVQVVELYNVNTEGTIVVRVPKDNRWTLRVPYENGLTELDGFPMENAKWTFSQTPTEYVFTSANPSIIIPGGGFSYFGLKARWNAGQTEGQFTLSTQITAGSGNEVRFSNNNDAEKLDYFIK